MKKIVVIGGGTGVFTVLSGLKNYPYALSAIVSMADNGGSTGSLREEFGILPPGDIRRALVALSASDNKILSELFNYRFEQGVGLKGHNMGNLLLTALERITGSFDRAVKEAVKILNVKGQVIPVTLIPTSLYAELENGEIIEGETNIDIPKHNGDIKIKRIFLKPEVKANPEAVQAINNADIVIIGPGDLYTSIFPNLIIPEITRAIQNTQAKVFYIINIMTKFGETNNFKASDFVRVIENQLGQNVVDNYFVNIEKSESQALVRYEEEKYQFVELDKANLEDRKFQVVAGNFLREGQFLRHDPDKLAQSLSAVIDEK